MKAKTELLLYRMLWLSLKPMSPGFRNVAESFEGWAYASGLLAQVQRLEAKGLLESVVDAESGRRLHRLTEAGRRVAMGPRDPEALWAEEWDGKWRLFLFDIPESQRSTRRTLTRALAAAGCGWLQGSVWISPRTPVEIDLIIGQEDRECSRLLSLTADSKGGRTDRRMVEEAWDFESINAGYRRYLAVLAGLEELQDRPMSRERLAEWSAAENRAWHKALAKDPLLPGPLLPSGYLGPEALQRRRSVLTLAAETAQAGS
jgi:phenylacetic acid degradation operon negative regulatory protein